MRHGLYTGRPAISVGRPMDLMGRATGGPKNVKAYALTCFVVIDLYFFFFFSCGFRGPAHEP